MRRPTMDSYDYEEYDGEGSFADEFLPNPESHCGLALEYISFRWLPSDW